MKLFLSHSSRNKPLVREIVKEFPPWLKAWVDERELLFGEDLPQALEQAIGADTDFVLLFFCEDAAKSKWVKQEIAWALEREQQEHREILLPVILGKVRRYLTPLGLHKRFALELKDYTERQSQVLAGQIAEHLSGWLVRRLETAVDAEKQARARMAAMETALHSSSEPLSEHFPYTIDRLEKDLVLKLDGSGYQTQRWIGLRANQSFVDLEIPWRFSVDLTDGAVGATQVSDIRPTACPVEFERLPDQGNDAQRHVRGIFRIVGHLAPKDREVSFQCRQFFKKAFLCTREEVLREYAGSDWREEYTSSSPVVAIRKMIIRVTFPTEFKIRTNRLSAIAFVGDTHVLHQGEMARIGEHLALTGNRAELEVDNPVIGLRYAISWVPPAARTMAPARPARGRG